MGTSRRTFLRALGASDALATLGATGVEAAALEDSQRYRTVVFTGAAEMFTDVPRQVGADDGPLLATVVVDASRRTVPSSRPPRDASPRTEPAAAGRARHAHTPPACSSYSSGV
jgi:hypothetical protein